MADLRLRILQSRFQNAFFRELAEVIVDEATRLGAHAEIVTTQVEAEPEDVFLLLPTHEYTALEGPQWTEQPRFTERAIGLTAEQPGSPFFDTNVALAGKLAQVWDFSAHSVAAYRSRGVPAHHLRFGWTPSWDRFRPDQETTYDLVFLGCLSEHREVALAGLNRLLWQRETRLLVSDNATPNWVDGPTFVTGDAKRDLLASSRILLNIHQSDVRYFEWLRAVEAAHCGAVLVSEPSLHTEPFVPGEHFVHAPTAGLALAAETLLADPDRLARMRTAAHELIKAHPFADSVARLLESADQVRTRGGGGVRVGPTRRSPLTPPHTAHWERQKSDADTVRQAIREIRLDMLDLRRGMRADGGAEPFVVDRTPAWCPDEPRRVSVVTTLYNYEKFVTDALESVASGSYADVEIVVVDDASTDGSRQRVVDWMGRTPHVPVTLVAHPVNRGLPRARNEALRHARGELVFVLDADNSVVPTGLDRLVAAMDADPTASLAYGVLQRFDAGGPIGLMGLWAWEPWRFRYGNYIDAMAMVRADVLRGLGGYTVDRRLHGWEDYDLWCRIAEAGGHATHVPTVVGRYRSSATSMLSLTNISMDAAFDALRERSPRVMSGVLEATPDTYGSWLGDLAAARTGRDAWLRSWEATR